MAPVIIDGMTTTIGVGIDIMTGVIIDTTDAMIEMATTIDGIADGIAIIITETLIGIATHATTTDGASSF